MWPKVDDRKCTEKKIIHEHWPKPLQCSTMSLDWMASNGKELARCWKVLGDAPKTTTFLRACFSSGLKFEALHLLGTNTLKNPFSGCCCCLEKSGSIVESADYYGKLWGYELCASCTLLRFWQFWKDLPLVGPGRLQRRRLITAYWEHGSHLCLQST